MPSKLQKAINYIILNKIDLNNKIAISELADYYELSGESFYYLTNQAKRNDLKLKY